MRTLKITFAFALVTAIAGAQSAPPEKIVATSAEIMAMVAKAKADGKYKGRPADPKLPSEIRRLSASMGPAAIAKQLGVARSTVYRLLGQA